MQVVRHARIPLCISDPNLPDNPVVFVNTAFLDLVGYSEDEIVGRNCRILQGPETTDESVKAVRCAINERRVETVEIVNYRKDGTRFLNALQIGPILHDEGKLIFFFGSQQDVTEKRDAELKARTLANEELIHRLRNIFSVMSVVIRMTAREEHDAKALASLVDERLRALSDAHLETLNRPGAQNLTLENLVQTILSSYAPKGAQQFRLNGPNVALPDGLLSCLSLCLHELATNSVKHGSFSVSKGLVDVTWDIQLSGDTRNLVFRWAETGGPKVATPNRSSGSQIVKDLIAAVNGSIEMHWKKSGVIVHAEFPL